ncbi:MAG: bifunctional 5,10-methylenetetrahydrofolate dehydrogenase/5,10-methenyltetrahydrofolate cyclohydrolase [Patescibacteria group bacterium]
MELLLGKLVAQKIFSETEKRILDSGIRPGLAVILVGDDEPSHLYVSLKQKAAEKIGIFFEKHLFSADVSQEKIFECIQSLNARKDIHGIIVQLPLPFGFTTDALIECIAPEKDTDGFHPRTIQDFLSGDTRALPVFPRAIIELLRATGQVFSGEKGLVIANSDLMGKVMAQALQNENLDAEYVLSPENTEELREKTQMSRVIVTACGRARLVTRDMLSAGVILIDGGISYENGKVVGDIDTSDLETKASFLSPVPGGVGPVTVASLLARVTDAALQTKNKP